MNRQIRANDDRWLDGPSPANVPIGFAYDRPFNTLKITDPMGRAVESYQLDAQDRPVSVTNIQGQVMTVNWGVGDYVKGIIRFDGSVVTNYYGADGRLLFVMNGAKGSHVIWTADGQLSYACGYTNSGTSWDEDGMLITNAFDALGRRNWECAVTAGRTNAVAYQFDPVGNVTNITVSNTQVRYGWTYDAAEKPLSLVAQAASNQVSIFNWLYNTNNGLVASVTNAATTESLGYDILDRATNIEWKTAGGTTVRGFGYAFNAAGMITNVSREDGGWTAYTYDSLDRLLSEKQYASTGLTYTASWNYDLAGNRTAAVTNGVTNLYSYAAGNILTNFGSGTLVQHDLAGNITNLQYSASRKLGLIWNGKYELTEVKTNGVTAEKYDYDALGRRARIIAGTTTNTFVYAGPHIVAEWSNNVLARSYSHGPGVDNILSMTTYGAATNTYFYIKDAIGSVHALVNTNGAVVEQYRYTAWGEVTVLSSNGTVLAASAYGNRFTWQGREVSYSTGLIFFRSRYYSASLGRWLSKDQIGINGGINLYQAFASNPVNFTDAFGLATYLVTVGMDVPSSQVTAIESAFRNSSYFNPAVDQVQVHYVARASYLANILGRYNDKKAWAHIGHGGGNMLFLDNRPGQTAPDTNLSGDSCNTGKYKSSNLGSLPQGGFLPDAKLMFLSCRSGLSMNGISSFAQSAANYFGRPALGAGSGVSWGGSGPTIRPHQRLMDSFDGTGGGGWQWFQPSGK